MPLELVFAALLLLFTHMHKKLLQMYGKNKNLFITYNIFFLHFQLKSLFNLLCEPILSTETNEFGNEMNFSEGPIVSLSSFYTKT